MECDSCGRYVPSADVLPTLDREGRLSMACARCRELKLRARDCSRSTSTAVDAPAWFYPELVGVFERDRTDAIADQRA